MKRSRFSDEQIIGILKERQAGLSATVILVFFANLLLHRPLIESLLFSLALAVGLTPELLPALGEPTWSARLSPEDYRGLTPLIYGHVNPYGRFDRDLNRRIEFKQKQAT
ncbi:hypothetical protein [Mesorhizobium sp. ES1-4]|uniref:hypothetical protein n=1 Tax=Mesorhizobium sp. ES1-4 TaxID=2876627 RepID=UPI001CCFD7E2|nr:hypothetical protein [Mesorhizobium sp. ES1-4]MBZ9798708.1 hypothetical protein [Mesorhizobium sp. ES1-4]